MCAHESFRHLIISAATLQRLLLKPRAACYYRAYIPISVLPPKHFEAAREVYEH